MSEPLPGPEDAPIGLRQAYADLLAYGGVLVERNLNATQDDQEELSLAKNWPGKFRALQDEEGESD